MIKLENVVLPSPMQWDGIIRGMRNPLESWDKSDSGFVNLKDIQLTDRIIENTDPGDKRLYVIGPEDFGLMAKLAKAGSDHRKFMRMIPVMLDITAPIFWWKEADTYKVATVRNSCSTMHKIHSHSFNVDFFSHEGCDMVDYARDELDRIVDICERLRDDFNETKDKKYWRSLIEILPESFNMKSTFTLNYEVLSNMYKSRKNHKLVEWHEFCDWIETLPCSEIITGNFE